MHQESKLTYNKQKGFYKYEKRFLFNNISLSIENLKLDSFSGYLLGGTYRRYKEK